MSPHKPCSSLKFSKTFFKVDPPFSEKEMITLADLMYHNKVLKVWLAVLSKREGQTRRELRDLRDFLSCLSFNGMDITIIQGRDPVFYLLVAELVCTRKGKMPPEYVGTICDRVYRVFSSYAYWFVEDAKDSKLNFSDFVSSRLQAGCKSNTRA